MSEIIIIRGTRHVVWECMTCGVVSTCPEIVYDRQKAEGGYHHCPNGHQWGWSQEKSEREKLRLERDRLRQDAARLEEELAAQRRRAEFAEQTAAKARKRTAAGVCPCCNRTFRQLALHMKNKHPSVVKLETKTTA